MAVLQKAARLLSRVAALFLVAMMAINVVDVGLRSTINAPIYGTYELVELMLAAVAFLAIPATFFRDGHVVIEIIDHVVFRRTVRFLRVMGLGLTVVFFALLTWYMVPPALDLIEFEEVTVDLHIPLIWRTVPVLIAMAATLVTVMALFVIEVKHLITRGGPS